MNMINFIEQATSSRRARRAAIESSYAAGNREWRTSFGLHAAVTLDPTTGGALWRATYYRENDGISGHSPREKLVDLLHELADEGFNIEAPGTLDVYGLATPIPTPHVTLAETVLAESA